MRSETADNQAEADGFVLLGDRPYAQPRDPLGFDGMAEQLASLVLASQDSTPFTLGVEAPWGSGKSSLMMQIRRHLESGEGEALGHQVHTVWFNAWTADNRKDVLEGLIKTVLEEIDPSILRKQLRSRRVYTGLRIASKAVSHWFGLGSMVDDLWKSFQLDPQLRNEMKAILEETMAEWIESTPRDLQGRLLVIFIDDLDRCSPENVFQVFEAIKLYLDLPGLVFVVGYDQTVVTEAILEQKKFSSSVTGREYIEKIIQIGFSIPRLEALQVEALMDSYLEQSGTSTVFRNVERELVIERNQRNPRRLKRFINLFILVRKTDQRAAEMKGTVLSKVLILYLYFPRFVRLFESSADPFEEFLRYFRCRNRLRGGDMQAADVTDFLEHLGLEGAAEAATASPEGVLQQVEQEIPEIYLELARDETFVRLVEDFSEDADRQKILLMLGSSLDFSTIQTEEEAVKRGESGRPLTEAVDLSGLHLAWFTPSPARREKELSFLKRMGVDVEVAPSLEEVLSLTAQALISDIPEIEEGDSAGLLNDPQMLQRLADRFPGPIVFYTSRLTASRRKSVQDLEEMNVHITDNITGLQDILTNWVRDESLKQGSKAAK
ncbi:MAG TPA: P-loop NTPase fold protein [Acidobacteriota bacterium]|nr:P-loop NTPase fold protein [Acidobacteriota bacterium]